MSAIVARHGVAAAGREPQATLSRLRCFHTLDALRGAAAFAVVLYHAHFIFGIAPPADGQVAVDLFFVMSGFIISYRYDADLAGGLGVLWFARIRLIRLYPLFLLGTLLGVVPAVVAVGTGHGSQLYDGMLESFPLALVMLPSHFTTPAIDELFPLNYVAWSLALELVVNIAYAATFRVWTLPRLVALLVAGFVGLCMCAAVYGTLGQGFDWAHVPVGVARILFGFTTGVVICRLHERRAFAFQAPWWLLVAAATALFFFTPDMDRRLWDLFVVCAAVPAIVVAAVANEPPAGLRKACAVAGIFSYAVYSLHVPLIGFFLRAEGRLDLLDAPQRSPEWITFLLVLSALCLAAHYCWDRPIRRWLTGLGRCTAKRRSAVASAASEQ